MRKLALVGLLSVAGSWPATAQTFNFDPPAFVGKFSQQLKGDNDDGVKHCQVSDGDLVCGFEDAAFQHSLAGLKQLNLINGNFDDKSQLIFKPATGKVKLIKLKGDRGDPANMFRTIGQVGSLLEALGMPKDKVTDELQALGLMRGDDAPDIGKPVVEITEQAAITCNNLPSEKATTFGCVMEPRY